MKVLDLRCSNHHHFEGWFGSLNDFESQNERALVECPMCGNAAITRMPSAVRLNLSAAPVKAATSTQQQAEPATPSQDTSVARMPDVQSLLMQAVKHVLANTEDMGERFPEEARRIHYGEAPDRGIRGHATPDEREALREEGIEIMALPMPAALKGPVQ